VVEVDRFGDRVEHRPARRRQAPELARDRLAVGDPDQRQVLSTRGRFGGMTS
jgi:hypothetical protein